MHTPRTTAPHPPLNNLGHLPTSSRQSIQNLVSTQHRGGSLMIESRWPVISISKLVSLNRKCMSCHIVIHPASPVPFALVLNDTLAASWNTSATPRLCFELHSECNHDVYTSVVEVKSDDHSGNWEWRSEYGCWSKTSGQFNSEWIRRNKRVDLPRYRDARILRATVRPSSYCTGCIPYRCRRLLTARSSRKSHLSAVWLWFYMFQWGNFLTDRKTKLQAYLLGQAKANSIRPSVGRAIESFHSL